mmetsp:Transcript_31605/g.83479  ORF Transcript_31605/g.83479 Transcript_31605/m.83479 type:complete len:231 (+) Transcript_31605:473-1165(+)
MATTTAARTTRVARTTSSAASGFRFPLPLSSSCSRAAPRASSLLRSPPACRSSSPSSVPTSSARSWRFGRMTSPPPTQSRGPTWVASGFTTSFGSSSPTFSSSLHSGVSMTWNRVRWRTSRRPKSLRRAALSPPTASLSTSPPLSATPPRRILSARATSALRPTRVAATRRCAAVPPSTCGRARCLSAVRSVRRSRPRSARATRPTLHRFWQRRTAARRLAPVTWRRRLH